MVGVNFFLTSSPILDLGHFSQVILPIVLLIMPQLSGAVQSMWWLGVFFWPLLPFLFDLFSHSGLRAFFSSDFTNCPTDYAPTIRCCSEHVMVGGFLFDLFSHSGLRAFFTIDFANCTTNLCPTIRCCSQHLMVGVNFFFWPLLPFWT